ncbi:hypothetical protein GCM10009868_31600 [Terrabacter aerolatus]|uniref:Uncharacterized protein n=1 Tax=Terrabacter aerolatus TaxID=422442 RepID=A0A512CYU4_9MICO|nr:hypothetical protein [Terrabacter aerolatus]GEO29396.1 hypothetical protein TAE01_12060 [Terrabacter aerolatus]
MSLETWWAQVRPETREWLVAHNGEPLPDAVVADILRVEGHVGADAWWADRDGNRGLSLSDAGVDWVEAVANDEIPQTPPADPSF